MKGEWDSYLGELLGSVPRYHGQLYPSVSAALTAIDWIESRSLVVLGFDGFDVDGESILPRLDRIADFSTGPHPIAIEGNWEQRVEGSCRAAKATLQQWLGDVQLVDLVVVSADEDPGRR